MGFEPVCSATTHVAPGPINTARGTWRAARAVTGARRCHATTNAMTPQPRLMIPGPIDLEPDVLEALAGQVIPHYGAAWVEAYERLRANLLAIAESEGDAFVLSGTGTVALDAAIGTAVPTGGQLIVVDNGFFSGRMREIAEGYGITVHVLRTERGDPVRPDELATFIQDHPEAKVVGLTHGETATGVLNDLETLAGVVKDAGRFLIVDAVSTLGAARVAVDAWDIDICCSASQKGLEAPPGAAPVIVNPSAWEFLESSGARHHGFYSDLRVWRSYARERAHDHPQPATMPVNIIAALTVGTDRILSEGPSARYARYAQTARRVRERLRSAGYTPLAAEEWASPTVTAVRPPAGLAADDVVDAVRAQANIQLGGGIADLAGQVFRIGHMGLSASDDYLGDLFGVLVALPREVARAAS